MSLVFHGKKYSHRNPSLFRIYAHFQADNDINNTHKVSKTTNVYKQNPVPNGYNILSELNDVLESGYYNSRSGYNNVNCFVEEVIKLENKMAFCFKNIYENNIFSKENEDNF